MKITYMDHSSYMESISNLAMLKLFHDHGVDVSEFPSFITHIEYSSGESYGIFYDGLSKIFKDIISVSYAEGISEEYEGVISKGAEWGVVIHDPFLNKAWRTNTKVYNQLISDTKFCEVEAELKRLPKSGGIAVSVFWPSHLHEIVEAILDIKTKSIEITKNHYERLNKNANHNKNQRQTA